MKAVFIAKIGKVCFNPSFTKRGKVEVSIEDVGQKIIKEIETDIVYSEGERIYLAEYDKSPKIEMVSRTLDGGYRYTLDFYDELEDNADEFNAAVKFSEYKYDQLNKKEKVEVTNKVKKLWNKARKKD